MELDDLLSRQTEYGCTVSSLRLLSDHYLVQKIRIESMSEGQHGVRIHLPGTHTKRSTANMVLIKARVVRASEPFLSVHPQKRIVAWDSNHGQFRYKTPLKYGVLQGPRVLPGEGVFYTGFNEGKVAVEGLDEPLFFIRGIDIEAAIPAEAIDQVQVGDFAMSRSSSAVDSYDSRN